MPTTTNFGWTTPADTDLVKDGALAIRTLGNGIDTSMVDLKGGTTGQVLSKASNTDMDFTWIAVDPLTILDAKGDLITATAADTPARLAVGTNGQVLTADSTTATGLKWATAGGGGKVLQVVYANSTTQTSISSTSYTDTGLSGSITPSAATSKVLVLITQNFAFSYGANTGAGAAVQLLRGSTSVLDLDGGSTDVIWFRTGLGNPNNVYALSLPVFYLDSPNTTSATTYKTQGKLGTTGNSANITFQNDSVDSVMILMEIGA